MHYIGICKVIKTIAAKKVIIETAPGFKFRTQNDDRVLRFNEISDRFSEGLRNGAIKDADTIEGMNLVEEKCVGCAGDYDFCTVQQDILQKDF